MSKKEDLKNKKNSKRRLKREIKKYREFKSKKIAYKILEGERRLKYANKIVDCYKKLQSLTKEELKK